MSEWLPLVPNTQKTTTKTKQIKLNILGDLVTPCEAKTCQNK